ncbi:phage tail protein [Pseudomonas costantinii]|uniref:Phage-related tail fibre protein n=1 Tax=Pseudomonas costantinii TaxID=168469 RepID=A0A1H4U250_9PSED|nr:phage tail protein [Pseudomonas costantinii]SEC62782.1 Phage-related tail fibre protein [Pseudomonas costantinii]
MIDQNSQFFAILTAVGEAKQANATALGLSWTFSQMGVGDANNTDPIPSRTQTKLINEWRRAPVNQVRPDPANPNIIITEQVIPADVGGKWIREIALYDADGDMVAVANCAPSFKPLLVQGTGKTQVIRMNFIVASTANIVLKIDPAVVLATREYADLQVVEAFAKYDYKQSVRVVATVNIALSGLQQLGAVALVAGDRVGAVAQTAAKDNGIWIVANGPWVRSFDANSSDKVTPCLSFAVEEGVLNGGSLWQLVTKAPIVLGTTPLAFEMLAGRTGVEPGTYRSLTVDKYGRATAGTNPNTLAGAGIEDAYTKPEIDLGLSRKANWGIRLADYGIGDAYTRDQTESRLAERMPVGGGDYSPTLSSIRINRNYSAINSPGGYIVYGPGDGGLSKAFAFICNRSDGNGGFSWRTVSSDNTWTGPTMSYSAEGILFVPSLVVTGTANVPTQAMSDSSSSPASTAFVKGWTSQYPTKDGISAVGLVGGDKTAPYLRVDATGELVLLQTSRPKDTALLSANGWSKNADTGEIIQWVEYALSDSPGTTLVDVTWPFQFPDQCLNVRSSVRQSTGSSSALSVAFYPLTRTGSTVRIEEWAAVVQTGLVLMVEARGV